MTRFLPHWRKATWAIAIFTGLMGAWLVSSFTPAPIVFWCAGMVLLGTVWLSSRNGLNVLIYGPGGKEWTVTPAHAERRVRQGWSYEPTTT
jgi:hypothetical protein